MRSLVLGVLRALTIGLLLSACSSIRVSADYDPTTDFSGLRTYSWIPDRATEGSDPRDGNPLVSDRVTRAIERELQALGYEQVGEQPDFTVGFSISVRRGVDVYSEPSYQMHYGRYGRYGGVGVAYGSTTQAREYEEGTLAIDLVDPQAKELLWRGTGSVRLQEGQTPEESTKRINEIVAEVLAQFPPG